MKPASPAGQPRRVKATFFAPLAVALTFILGAVTAAFYLLEVRVRDRELAEHSTAVASLIAQKLEKDTNLMRAILLAMMADERVEAAFRNRDRQALARRGGALFESLRANHHITHLYFTGPDLVNVYRMHSPGEYGDTIHRQTILRAREQEEPVGGLELGPLGTLTLRLVLPWRHDEQVVGYLEIGEEVQHLIGEIRDSLAVDLLVLVDKSRLLPEQWQRGMELMRRSGDWQRFSTHAALAQTVDQLPAALDDRLLARVLTTGSAQARDGERTLHLAALPLDDSGGRHLGEVLVIRDITGLEANFQASLAMVVAVSLLAAAGVLGVFHFALQQVERDYRRQDDLEYRLRRLGMEHQRILQLEKLSALGTMVGSIAHQLNNPLVGVVNLAQLAAREADDPARSRELLADIRRAGEDCRDLVRRMLDFSKVSNLERKPTPMAPLIEDTVLLFRQAEPRHLPVALDLPAEPPVLEVDPILVRHALFNLLANAAQATEGEGDIAISLAPAADTTSGAPGWALAVSDKGKGIAPQLMDKIFVPFFTTRSDGTGLGLPVVQHVALVHDGHVDAAPRPGGGMRFAIWLPASPPEPARHAA